MLKGTKKLSFKRAVEIAKRLKFTKKQTEQLLLSIQIGKIEDPEYRESLLKSRGENGVIQRDLSIDVFRLLGDWYHLPIYEATEMEGFKWDARAISKRFGISIIEANQAMERLVRLELVGLDKKGRAKKLSNHILVESKVPNETIRKLYRGVIGKAIEALETQSPKEKVVGTEFFALDPNDLEKVKELTDEYFSSLLKISQAGKNKTELYASFAEVFRISQINKNMKGNI